MFRLLAICVVFVVASSAFADDKTKPNTLTPTEIADGWILHCGSLVPPTIQNTLTPTEIADGWILLFDGETTYGWSAADTNDKKKPELAVKDGILTIAGKGSDVRLTTRFEYFELNGEYRTATKGSQLSIELRQPGNNVAIKMGDTLLPVEENEWRKLVVRMTPRELIVSAGEPGKSGIKGSSPGGHSITTVGFFLPNQDEGRIELRNLKLRPLATKPLFNGKNLEGWSINKADPKRMASKWEVNKDGELSLKNGPGDLVSEKEFDNFVLQVDCKSLGKWLNSGVFFRCIPGQYQNGYECQIQNGFKENDRTKPVDFGTGAIYRRIPARKVVSNDNEWFTMTIVADEKHIATWVNGYQTVDWTDERAANDNPRNGYRAAKGPLSIQGHDPTTDLLFRNIRIAELPAEKK